jgi:hypothetical protein
VEKELRKGIIKSRQNLEVAERIETKAREAS